MELRLYLDILRRRWPIVVALPLLVALISGAAALARPPRYGTATRLLVTRGDAPAGSTAGLNDLREDKTAQDLPAIVSGAPFRRDLAEELARQGRPVDEAALAGAIQAGYQDHTVTIAVAADSAANAELIAQTAVELLQRNGLRYWGEPNATPAQPGLNVAVLESPAPAARLNGPRALLLEVALRALLGLLAAVGLVFALHYLANM
jgi:capsular polysaccharide biosynthesis protein